MHCFKNSESDASVLHDYLKRMFLGWRSHKKGNERVAVLIAASRFYDNEIAAIYRCTIGSPISSKAAIQLSALECDLRFLLTVHNSDLKIRVTEKALIKLDYILIKTSFTTVKKIGDENCTFSYWEHMILHIKKIYISLYTNDLHRHAQTI